MFNDLGKFGKIRNSKYKTCTNLWRNIADKIMRKEELADKYAYIDINKDIKNYITQRFLLKSKRILE